MPSSKSSTVSTEDVVKWAMSRFSRPRKPGLVTIGPPPVHVEKLAAFGAEMKEMREAWEAYDKTMLLSDNDPKAADRAFEAARKRPRKKKLAR
ncbi:MAG TPA: hypothetical protein VF077_10335 [Nitrospiraceae bacterium]